jgi:transposase
VQLHAPRLILVLPLPYEQAEQLQRLGYTGSANLLVRYLNQGDADAVRKPPSPRRLVAWLMTTTTDLPAHHQKHLRDLLTACAHLTALAERVKQFAGLLTERCSQDLDGWMNTVDADDLPALHGFVHGLRMDLPAVIAGLTLPSSNGPIEAPTPRSSS